MPDTPDRAALAERLDAIEADRERFADRVSELYRTDPECQATRSKISFSHARALAWHKAMQERIALAAPAVPPSVAEARSVVMRGAAQFGYASDADVDALIAAVRAATAAKAVRAVDALPRSEGVTTFGHTGFVMERTEGGSWIYDEHALDALRALGGQP